MKKLNWAVIGLVTFAVGSPGVSLAADAKNGKLLHDASCIVQCHAGRSNGESNKIYVREGNKKSLEALKAQVATCNQMVLSSKWFPEDEADVVEYLNQEFYHLK